MKTSLVSFATITAFALSQIFTSLPALADEAKRNLTVTAKEYRYNTPYTENTTNTSPTDHSDLTLANEQINAQATLTMAQARTDKYVGLTKLASDITITSVNEFWIYETWLTLGNDTDYDGYYSTFSIEFDADTIFTSSPVYAVLYIGRNGVYDAIHASSDFYIYGEDATDTFTIDSTLVSGFPSDDYDVLIELYDAYTETLVAFTDGFDDSVLAYVPLESQNNEYVVEDTVVIVEEHGGSWSLFYLLLVAGAVLCRRVKNK